MLYKTTPTLCLVVVESNTFVNITKIHPQIITEINLVGSERGRWQKNEESRKPADKSIKRWKTNSRRRWVVCYFEGGKVFFFFLKNHKNFSHKARGKGSYGKYMCFYCPENSSLVLCVPFFPTDNNFQIFYSYTTETTEIQIQKSSKRITESLRNILSTSSLSLWNLRTNDDFNDDKKIKL